MLAVVYSLVLKWTAGHQVFKGTRFWFPATTGDAFIMVVSVEAKISMDGGNMPVNLLTA